MCPKHKITSQFNLEKTKTQHTEAKAPLVMRVAGHGSVGQIADPDGVAAILIQLANASKSGILYDMDPNQSAGKKPGESFCQDMGCVTAKISNNSVSVYGIAHVALTKEWNCFVTDNYKPSNAKFGFLENAEKLEESPNDRWNNWLQYKHINGGLVGVFDGTEPKKVNGVVQTNDDGSTKMTQKWTGTFENGEPGGATKLITEAFQKPEECSVNIGSLVYCGGGQASLDEINYYANNFPDIPFIHFKTEKLQQGDNLKKSVTDQYGEVQAAVEKGDLKFGNEAVERKMITIGDKQVEIAANKAGIELLKKQGFKLDDIGQNQRAKLS